MNKRKFFIATLLVAAAVSVAVVSCKKETPNALHNNTSPSVNTFAVPQVDDMNAYLKDFKKKMQTATRDENETLSLEEAAWHLSSVANYDFANICAKYDNLRFDTLYTTVRVTENSILLSDLALVYENISEDIDEFYNSLMIENKGFYFIDVFISEYGTVSVSIITTFNSGSRYLDDTCYFYQDAWTAMVDCYELFDGFENLPVQSTGTTELKRAINLRGSAPHLSGYYFTISSSRRFHFSENIDPYGSPSLWDSRLYANTAYFNNFNLLQNDMICYYLDSYIGLGVDNCPQGEYVVSFNPVLKITDSGTPLRVQHHELTVKYGEMHPINSYPGGSQY